MNNNNIIMNIIMNNLNNIETIRITIILNNTSYI